LNVVNTSATFLKQDTTTEGNWIGVYGADGYDIVSNPSTNNPNYLPSGVTVTPAGETSYTWPNPGTATSALEVPPTGSTRIAAAWYSATSFTVDVDVTNSQSYNLELYVLDYDRSGRSEQIQFTNEVTGAVLSTETVSNFSGGAYLNYTISGNVLIAITRLTGNNAVLSGLFFDRVSGDDALVASLRSEDQDDGIGAGSQAGTDQVGALDLPSRPLSSSLATKFAVHDVALSGIGIGAATTPAVIDLGTVDSSSTDGTTLLPADSLLMPSDKLVQQDVALEQVYVGQGRSRSRFGR
jgi:hypothetical protein